VNTPSLKACLREGSPAIDPLRFTKILDSCHNTEVICSNYKTHDVMNDCTSMLPIEFIALNILIQCLMPGLLTEGLA
jgi:hypothetical protein